MTSSQVAQQAFTTTARAVYDKIQAGLFDVSKGNNGIKVGNAEVQQQEEQHEESKSSCCT